MVPLNHVSGCRKASHLQATHRQAIGGRKTLLRGNVRIAVNAGLGGLLDHLFLFPLLLLFFLVINEALYFAVRYRKNLPHRVIKMLEFVFIFRFVFCWYFHLRLSHVSFNEGNVFRLTSFWRVARNSEASPFTHLTSRNLSR